MTLNPLSSMDLNLVMPLPHMEGQAEMEAGRGVLTCPLFANEGERLKEETGPQPQQLG